MKSYKSTLLLLAVFLAIGSYAYFVEFKGNEKKEAQKIENAKIFQGLKPEEVQQITLTWAAAKTVLAKENNAWILKNPVQDSVDSVAMEALLAAIKDESFEQVVKEGEGIDLNKFGLSSPVGTVQLLSTSGQTFEASFGTVDGMGGIKYLYLPSQKKLVTASNMTQTKFQKTARDLREKKIMNLVPADVTKLEYQGSLKATLVKTPAGWIYENQKGSVEQNKVANYLQELTGIRAAEFVSELKDDAEAKKKYGLNKSEARITVTKADGTTQSLIYHGTKDGKSYLTRADRPQVFEVQANTFETLKIRDAQFRDTKFPFKFDPAQVSAIEIRSPISKQSMKRQQGIWKLTQDEGGKQPSSAKIQGLMQALGALEVQEFTKSVKGQVLGSIQLSDAEGKVIFKLEYGRDQGKDGRIVTTSAGADEVFLVSRSAIASLPLQDLFEEAPKQAGDIQVKEVPAETGSKAK